jgi:quercetin dioxygenase-like cupin family protein
MIEEREPRLENRHTGELHAQQEVSSMAEYRIARAGEGKTMKPSPEEDLVFKITGEDTDGQFDYVEGTIQHLGGPPMHVHHFQDETFYVVEGELRFTVGEEMLDLRAGDFAYIPRGVAHGYVNMKQEPVRGLGVFVPGGFDRFMDEVGQLPQGPPDPEKMRELGEKYGQEVVGPPLAVSLGLVQR